MSQTVSLRYVSKLTVTPTNTGPFVSSGDNSFVVNGLDADATYNAGTSIPVTKYVAFEQALTAGAATINFAALPGATADETINATGLKPQFVKLKNKASNANNITITEGASNGLALFGASFSITLKPGQECQFNLNEACDDVAAGDRTIDLAGTGTQVLQVIVGLG